jgi:hypothetical protein
MARERNPLIPVEINEEGEMKVLDAKANLYTKNDARKWMKEHMPDGGTVMFVRPVVRIKMALQKKFAFEELDA